MPIFFNKVTPVEPVRQQQQPKSFAEIVAELKRQQQTKQAIQETTRERSLPERLTEKPKRNKKTSAYMQDLMHK